MSRPVSMCFKLKEIYAIKHALELQIKTKDASTADKDVEKRLVDRIVEEINLSHGIKKLTQEHYSEV